MIGLTIAHVVPRMHANAAASMALHLCQWLEANGHNTLLISGGGVREDEGKAIAGETITYQSGGPGWLLGGRRKVVKQAAKWNPDVVHVHSRDGIALGVTIADKVGAALVVSLHNLPDEDLSTELGDPRIRLVLVATSSQRATLISRCGVPKEKVSILPYALEADSFGDAIATGGITTVGMAGNFSDDRDGFLLLLDALQRCRTAGCELRGLLCGGAGEPEAIEAHARKHALSEVVVVERQEGRLGPVLNRVEVFVFGVAGDGNPVALLKAMAAGRAIVAAAAGPVPELLDDGQTGLLVPRDDAEALAAALQRLVAEPELAAGLGRQAQQAVQARSAIEEVGDVAHEIYRSAIRGGAESGTETMTAYRRMTEGAEEAAS